MLQHINISELHESTFQTIEASIGKGDNVKVMLVVSFVMSKTFCSNCNNKMFNNLHNVTIKSCQENFLSK
jgi:hypothetical protein